MNPEPSLDVNSSLEVVKRTLDEMQPAARRDTVLQLRPRELATLFERCAEAPAVRLTDLVPADVPPLIEVIHDGKNSLPAFNRFQKRFCRPPTTELNQQGELWGYNEQAMRAVTGPGYFIVHSQHASESKGEPGGELVVDYRQLPPSKPDAWPVIRSNSARLSRFVYAGSVDLLRHVCEGVTIGRVYKAGHAVDAWFALVRRDPPG